MSSTVIRSCSPALFCTTHTRRLTLAALGFFGEPARRAHPVQRLIRAVVGVHTHRAVGFEEQQPRAEGKCAVSRPT